MTFKKFNKQVLSKANLEEPQDVLRVINTLQNNIENSFNPIVSNIQNDSTILQNIQLLAGQNNIVNHTLNRNLMGYNIIRLRANSIVWDTQDSNPSPNLTLWLSCSANVIVDLEVF